MCASCVRRCNEFLANYNRDNVEWKCVVGGDARTCMQMVRDGDAELTKFGGGCRANAGRSDAAQVWGIFR